MDGSILKPDDVSKICQLVTANACAESWMIRSVEPHYYNKIENVSDIYGNVGLFQTGLS